MCEREPAVEYESTSDDLDRPVFKLKKLRPDPACPLCGGNGAVPGQVYWVCCTCLVECEEEWDE